MYRSMRRGKVSRPTPIVSTAPSSARSDTSLASVIELRYFAGLTVEETAELLVGAVVRFLSRGPHHCSRWDGNGIRGGSRAGLPQAGRLESCCLRDRHS